MKFLVVLFFSLIVAPVFAQPLSDRTGLSTSFDVQVDDNIFAIHSVANFDIQDVKFEEDKLIFEIKSSLANNLGELQIPQNMTRGQIHFYLDGNEISPKVLQNEKISFVTLEFDGNGTHTLEITSDYVPAVKGHPIQPSKESTEEKFDQIITVVAVIGVAIVIGVGSTLAFYFKRKPKTA
ncbi:MAG: hypothetical protein ACT4NT_05815 [Nitrososphaerota archaeon]